LKYIDYIIDISIKEDKSIPDIITEDQFLNLLSDKGLNTPQKAKKMLEILKCRRLPFLTDSEKRFNRKITALDLPNVVRVSHPPFFETQDYRLEIVFKDGRGLKRTIDLLAHIKGLEDIVDPWEGS
jgi:hypothetical protein